MIQQVLAKATAGEVLSADEAYKAMSTIMSGEATDAQIGAYLTALHIHGESPEIIAGSARAMREACTPIHIDRDVVVDTCGTGGDGAHTINISTGAALVAAGAGLTVAKHGNRSITSRSGSADVLDALGVNIDIGPDGIQTCLEQVGIAFLFAIKLHPAMKHAIGPRKEIGIRTLFNILGPLSNPASARHGVLGVFSAALVPVVAEALANLDVIHYLVVHGGDGLDELTTTTSSSVAEVKNGSVELTEIHPSDLGLPVCKPEDLRGGEPEENAAGLRAILEGKSGPHRDIILLNAAAALVAGQTVSTLQDGIAKAAETIDSGAAREKLNALVETSSQFG